MGVIAFIIFFLAGLGFGYAASPRAKWLPLLFPIALSIGAFINGGDTGPIFVRLAIALAVTIVGIAIGWLLEARSEGRRASAA